jgi:hypothetical protein
MPTREEIEAELNETDTQKAVRLLRETLVEIEEFEKQLATAEKTACLGYAPKMPIIERMVRLGCSKAACNRVAEALTLMSTLERGRPLAGQLRTLLADPRQQRSHQRPSRLDHRTQRWSPRAARRTVRMLVDFQLHDYSARSARTAFTWQAE